MDLAGSISRSIHTANGDSGSHCNKQSIGKGWRLRNTCNRADTSRIQHLMTPAWRWPMSCKLASVKSCFGTLGPRGTGYSTASISTPVWGRGGSVRPVCYLQRRQVRTYDCPASLYKDSQLPPLRHLSILQHSIHKTFKQLNLL